MELRAALRRWLLANVVNPGATMQDLINDETRLHDWVKQRATGFYHPVGTCRMGPEGASVVDSHCRVRGIQGLAIADASVMPSIVRANTHLTTLMIAEKASDHLLQKDNA